MKYSFEEPASSTNGYLTQDDEMSLRQARARQSDDSIPDTLGIRGDELTILNEELWPWRQPARVVLGVLAAGLGVLIVGAILTRNTANAQGSA